MSSSNQVAPIIMKIIILLVIIHTVTCQSNQLSEEKEQKVSVTQNLQKLQDLLQEKILNSRLQSKQFNQSKQAKDLRDSENSSRKSKSLAFFPFYPPPMIPYGTPSGYYYPQNKEIAENSYPNEWLSRTEPFKKNPPLLDSPTYYIRLPPNPYVFVPGMGYVSRPPSLSDPEVLQSSQPDHRPNQVGNDIYHDPFYRLPINFLSNGKPTSVYQLPNSQPVPKPDSALINLTKGPYVFNGKPNEIYLVAQIYDALYGDELTHFYP